MGIVAGMMMVSRLVEERPPAEANPGGPLEGCIDSGAFER